MEIDRHLIAEKIESSKVQLVYIPTRALQGPNFEELYNKLGMNNIYNALEGVLNFPQRYPIYSFLCAFLCKEIRESENLNFPIRRIQTS